METTGSGMHEQEDRGRGRWCIPGGWVGGIPRSMPHAPPGNMRYRTVQPLAYYSTVQHDQKQCLSTLTVHAHSAACPAHAVPGSMPFPSVLEACSRPVYNARSWPLSVQACSWVCSTGMLQDSGVEALPASGVQHGHGKLQHRPGQVSITPARGMQNNSYVQNSSITGRNRSRTVRTAQEQVSAGKA